MGLKSMLKKTLLFLKNHGDVHVNHTETDYYVYDSDGTGHLVYGPGSHFEKKYPDLGELIKKFHERTPEQNDEETAQTSESSSQNSSDFT